MRHGKYLKAMQHSRLVTTNIQSTAVYYQGIIATKDIILTGRIMTCEAQVGMMHSQTGKPSLNSKDVHFLGDFRFKVLIG